MVTVEEAGPMTPTMFLTFLDTLGHMRVDAFNDADSEKGVLSKWKKGDDDMAGDAGELLDPLESIEDEDSASDCGEAKLKGDWGDINGDAKWLVDLLEESFTVSLVTWKGEANDWPRGDIADIGSISGS